MAYPTSFSGHSSQPHSCNQGAAGHGSVHASTLSGATGGIAHRINAPAASPLSATPQRADGETAGDHQLEKLEFALAVALTRGDQQRSALLRQQIDALGGNREEPGT